MRHAADDTIIDILADIAAYADVSMPLAGFTLMPAYAI